MADTPKAYKLNKERRAAEADGKFLYYFYDRKKLTSVALPAEQFDKLVEMDRGGDYIKKRNLTGKSGTECSDKINGTI